MATSSPRFLPVYRLISLLLLVSLACSLPGFAADKSTPAPASPEVIQPIPETEAVSAPPAPSPTPLPPALVETNPPPASEIPLAQPITLFFSQAMDRASVEGAISGQPVLSGSFQWADEATLTFVPDAPFLPNSDLVVNVSANARSRGGLALVNPVSLQYHTAGYLRLAQPLPEPGTQEVNPSSAIVASFNRPVVALEGDSPGSGPAAFTVRGPAGEPAGQGRWINTSTYAFYPDPALAGAAEYTVQVDPALVSVDGSPLENPEAAVWSFQTAAPEIVRVEPELNGPLAPLDQAVTFAFNQPMDPGSVEANFALQGPDGLPIPGTFTWDEAAATLVFTPTRLLDRSTGYSFRLGEDSLTEGGTPLGSAYQSSFRTVPDFAVSASQPVQGGLLPAYTPLEIRFSSPLPRQGYLQYISITPPVPSYNEYLDETGYLLQLYANFAPDTTYTLTLSANFADRWGSVLGEPYVLRFTTASLPPELMLPVGSEVIFLTPQDEGLALIATNLPEVPVLFGSVLLDEFLLMAGAQGWDIRRTYLPGDARTWRQPLDLPLNQSERVSLPLTQAGAPLAPGLYYLRFDLNSQGIYAGPYLLVVSHVQLTVKQSANQVLVWAVDTRTGQPVTGAPVTIYADSGAALASGQTDGQGLFQAAIEPQPDPYLPIFAALAQPGEELFSLGLSNWTEGLMGYDFGYLVDLAAPRLKIYYTTDRPIYQPGQTVYFRAVARQASNTRYRLPELSSLTVGVYDPAGEPITSFDLPLSAFGTAHSSYLISETAQPGYYRIGDGPDSLYFKVADYRKPEINLEVSFAAPEALAGDSLDATVEARYFFDAPVANAPIQWTLYAITSTYSLPGFQVGTESTSWLYGPGYLPGPFGRQIHQSVDQTGSDGVLRLQLPSQAGVKDRLIYTLEATVTDESGRPVSARAEIPVHPNAHYLGVRPEQWAGEAGSPQGFEVKVVRWDGQEPGSLSLQASFEKVTWMRDESQDIPGFRPVYIPIREPVASADFVTTPAGEARLEFTPPAAGTYLLSITGAGAYTDLSVWVAGEGLSYAWPSLPEQRLILRADQESYQPGDTARVTLPNPFGAGALALITTERGAILHAEVRAIDEAGITLEVPLTEIDAPNVYLSVILLGRADQGSLDFRAGLLNLPVNPEQLLLNVTLTADPERAGPGDSVRLRLRVTDSSGEPVAGEFAVAVVDRAVLALADPNSKPIAESFYGLQPLGTRTGLSLAAWGNRPIQPARGQGGGGGEAEGQVVRENFPDTAYWSAEVVTDANGEAEVALTLPDSLTTWLVDVRGVGEDTRVGQASLDLVTTKDLLVRPVAPRFLVSGDRVLLAAIVQNNTAYDLQAGVTLQAEGFTLDEPESAQQTLSVPAQGRLRVEWWGTVEAVDRVDLVFSTSAGGLQDSVRVSGLRPDGEPGIPVYRYATPQVFATSGVMDAAGDRLEVVSLPRQYDLVGGSLRLELAPSLASAILSALEAEETPRYENNAELLSGLLENLQTFLLLQEYGLTDPALQERLANALDRGISRLVSRQNPDGGWSWWINGESDVFMTAFLLFGFAQARQAGILLDIQPVATAIQAGEAFLRQSLPEPDPAEEAWRLDQAAFEIFALSQVSDVEVAWLDVLYDQKERLAPWARALLALTLEARSAGDERAAELLSALQTEAIRSASAAHWEEAERRLQNFGTPLTTSAIVTYALARREPAAPVLVDAMRYLMAHRTSAGAWSSSYETSWVLLALIEYVRGTGEMFASFDFGASLNGSPVLSGQAGGSGDLTPVNAVLPLDTLFPDDPNALVIHRGEGGGRLYYQLSLAVDAPVEAVPPANRGLRVERAYFSTAEACPPGGECLPAGSAQVGEQLQVRVRLTVPEDAYSVVLEDYIPAGSEIRDPNLETSQLGEEPQPQPLYDPAAPFSTGWGAWYFDAPHIYRDRIAWTAAYLPAGTYELSYTLVAMQAGEYKVLPARAWQYYFPDVQGSSAGELFAITP